MHHLHPSRFLIHHSKLFLAVALLPTVAMTTVALRRYLAARRNRPTIAKTDIVHEERFASGASQKNFMTQISGAHNCLRLVVTKEILWVTSWFPFSLLTAFYDLEHVIPIRSILSIHGLQTLRLNGLVLTYSDDCGANHSLNLYPKDRDAFLRALSSNPNQPVTHIRI